MRVGPSHALDTAPRGGHHRTVEAPQRTRKGSRVGYSIALVGAALYVAGCFLPFWGTGVPTSLFDDLGRTDSLHSAGVVVGESMFLFAGIVVVAVASVLGLRADDPRRAWPWLASGVTAWGLTGLGWLLRYSAGAGFYPRADPWFMLAGVLIVAAGSVVAAVTSRTKTTGPVAAQK